MMSKDLKKHYDLRFRHFIREITGVSRMKPKEKYLYRIMDGVPFKDLETAIIMTKMDCQHDLENSVNDNAKG